MPFLRYACSHNLTYKVAVFVVLGTTYPLYKVRTTTQLLFHVT
nr:MAG TPA: hypothetical protein [Crassvirales sp.]